jgi:hypothetical protein
MGQKKSTAHRGPLIALLWAHRAESHTGSNRLSNRNCVDVTPRVSLNNVRRGATVDLSVASATNSSSVAARGRGGRRGSISFFPVWADAGSFLFFPLFSVSFFFSVSSFLSYFISFSIFFFISFSCFFYFLFYFLFLFLVFYFLFLFLYLFLFLFSFFISHFFYIYLFLLVNICFLFNNFFHRVHICLFLSLFLFSFHYCSSII